MVFPEKERLIENSFKEKMVGMGEMKLACNDEVLWTVLGSCVGVVLYDRDAAIGGIAHVMLPKKENENDFNMGKYADTAIPHIVYLMVKNGCRKNRIKARLAGGANMFKWKINDPNMEIGGKNIAAVEAALKAEGIPVVKSAVGGNVGYKLKFCASDGSVSIRFIDGRTIEL